MNLLYLIGEPGSGKSTLAALLTDGCLTADAAKPFAYRVVRAPAGGAAVIELGAHRNAFSGTDALSMSVQPKVLAWLVEERPPLVLGEGDRLANTKFLAGAIRAGYTLHVAYLHVSPETGHARRVGRAAALGVRPQKDTWVAGRVTKTLNLAGAWSTVKPPHTFTRLNADLTPAEVLAELEATDDPVVAALRSEA